MKLFNKTRLPDAVLEPLLTAAGRAVGARTGTVVVKVTAGRYGGVSGTAYYAVFVNTWHLRRVKRWKNQKVNTDGGWFEIRIPATPGWNPGRDSLSVAESFFKIAMHEWAHVRDYQRGRWLLPWSRRGTGRRRPKHDSRPEEVRAIDAVDDAVARGAIVRHQDLIIALALGHEALAFAISSNRTGLKLVPSANPVEVYLGQNLSRS